MAGTTYSGAGSIHALLAKMTKLDATGAPATGDDNVLWSDSLVAASLGVNLNEPDPIKQTNGAGVTCMVYQAPKTIDSLNVDTLSWCTPDPRILEFAIGGDVIIDADHETQRIAITGGPTGGSTTVSYDGEDAVIPYNATASQVTTLLNAIVPGGVKSTGGPLPGSPIDVTFNSREDVAQFTKVDAFTGGTAPASTITTVNAGGANDDPPKAIGYAAPAIGAAGKPNGVALELWSRAVQGGSVVGVFHWLFPRLDLSLSSDGFELGAEDPLTPTFTGTGAENVNFGTGADGSWDYGISDRVYQWVLEDDLPIYVPGYATQTA